MSSKTEFEIYQEAFEKINWKEAVAPVVRGVMLVEDSQVEAYNKIQKLLNSTGMESCHQFLLDLDPSELTEAEATKVNNLFKLAQERGVVETDEDDEDTATEEKPVDEEDLIFTTPVQQPKPPVIKPEPAQPSSAFTILYSAMRNGSIKTGEAFSNALDTRSAKADVISKLERAGYQNISILAIEAGDPDTVGCDNTYCKQRNYDDIPDYSDDVEIESEKCQMIGNTLTPAGIKPSTANSYGQNIVSTTVVTPDDDQEEIIDDIDEEDVEENDILHNRKHNAHVNEEDEDADNNEDKDEDSGTDDEDSGTDEEKDEEDSGDEKDDEKDEEDNEETKEEDVEEPDEKLKSDDDDEQVADDEEKELTQAEKDQLKDSYKKAFKAAMQKCKFKTAFIDLSLEDKVKFFTELSKAWGDKADPSKFMTDKETEQLEKIVVKK